MNDNFSIGSFLFLLYLIFLLFFGIYQFGKDINYTNNLESVCNQTYDTNSCSVVYEDNDVVLFNTYNGYVTMENILK